MGKVFTSDVIAAAAEIGGIPPEALSGSRGVPAVCALRKQAMFVATELTGKTATQIGRAFGRRDHCTVVLARQQVGPKLALDATVAAAVARIRQRAQEIAAKAGRAQ